MELCMLSLIWKEWHEQRWKLAFGALVLCAFALIGLRTRVVADETLLTWVCFLGIMLLPILTAMGLVPAERQEGTIGSLLALPVSTWRIFIVKTLLGILLCAGPLLCALVVSILAAGGRELTASQMFELFVRSVAATLVLFAWMFCLTVRLPTEARAGLLAVGILIFWLLATAGIYAVTPSDNYFTSRGMAVPHDVAVTKLWLISPFIFTFGFRLESVALLSVGLAIVIQLAIAAALWFWAARRLTAPAQDE
jgi:hypothetical protein